MQQQLNVLLSLWILLSIGSSSSLATVLQYSQTVPVAGIVPCHGDRVVLTCTTDTGRVVWKPTDGGGTPELTNTVRSITVEGGLSLEVTAVNGDMITSTATIKSVNISHNGTMIGCTDEFTGGDNYLYLSINVTGPPMLPVDNITIAPINNSAIFINWREQQHCISYYNITITSNETFTENKSINTSSATIGSLIIGTNYSFIIIPIDTIGREGPPSSLIQYIWNVPAQVVNISWYQISTDGITIWWNSTQDTSIHYPPVHYIINVDPPHNNISNTANTNNVTITGLPLTDTNYTVTIIPVNIIGQGPSATVNDVSITPTMTSTSVVPTSVASSVTLTTDISTSTSLIVISSTSIIVSSANEGRSLSFISTTTSPSTTVISTPDSPATESTTATGSNSVPVISGAIGIILIIIIIIIIILIITLVYAKRHRIKNKESYTVNGNGNESKGVTDSSYRNNNIELQPTDPTYATPTTEYTPAAASTVRTLQGGDGPPSYPPPPPTTGQYSVLRTSDDDDEVPPPVPAYNPNGVQEYSELRREGEKKNKQQQQQGAGPLYSTLNQDDDTPPPVPPAYNPEGVQEYSVLKREGENKGQQGLSTDPTGLYSTINKDTNNQVLVDESAHKPVYADLAIAAKGKRLQAAPTQEQPVVYASVNNKSVPPPIPPPAAPHKVLYADLSIAAGKRTPKNKPPTEERVVYAAVNGNRKSTTQELIMDRLGGLDIPPPIPPKPKP